MLKSDRLSLCTANVMLSIGSVPACFASDENFTPYVSHYGLYENSYVVSSTFSHPDFVDKENGDSVETDLKCIPWACGGGQGEVVTFTGAHMRVSHADDRFVMLLRNYRPHAPRKLLDVFSYSTSTYTLDIPVEGTRLELKEGDVVVIRSERDTFCTTNRRVGIEPVKFNDNWQTFVCLPDLTSFPEGCAHLSKRGVCRQIRERVEAFVETFDVAYDSTHEKFMFASNATRYVSYENRTFDQLVKHTGRVYAEGVEADSEDEGSKLTDDKDVVSFAAMTVDECGEGGRAKKRSLEEEGVDSACSKKPKA
jgi:hypothetical protein